MDVQQQVMGASVGTMMEDAGIAWWAVYLGCVVVSALVAYLTVLILKGLCKSWRNRDSKTSDPWWWQWGWRAASVLVGCGVGAFLVDPPWGPALGLVGGGFASWIVGLVKSVVKKRAERLVL